MIKFYIRRRGGEGRGGEGRGGWSCFQIHFKLETQVDGYRRLEKLEPESETNRAHDYH